MDYNRPQSRCHSRHVQDLNVYTMAALAKSMKPTCPECPLRMHTKKMQSLIPDKLTDERVGKKA
jgi:hypothetical protein